MLKARERYSTRAQPWASESRQETLLGCHQHHDNRLRAWVHARYDLYITASSCMCFSTSVQNFCVHPPQSTRPISRTTLGLKCLYMYKKHSTAYTYLDVVIIQYCKSFSHISLPRARPGKLRSPLSTTTSSSQPLTPRYM